MHFDLYSFIVKLIVVKHDVIVASITIIVADLIASAIIPILTIIKTAAAILTIYDLAVDVIDYVVVYILVNFSFIAIATVTHDCVSRRHDVCLWITNAPDFADAITTPLITVHFRT